jgi:hypothetical protein
VNQISSEIPSKFSLSQNYPNPFNPKTNIKFNIATLGDVKIVIFDVVGRKVQIIVNEKLQPGTYNVIFDGSTFPSGVYFYTMKSLSFIETKKMILIK